MPLFRSCQAVDSSTLTRSTRADESCVWKSGAPLYRKGYVGPSPRIVTQRSHRPLPSSTTRHLETARPPPQPHSETTVPVVQNGSFASAAIEAETFAANNSADDLSNLVLPTPPPLRRSRRSTVHYLRFPSQTYANLVNEMSRLVRLADVLQERWRSREETLAKAQGRDVARCVALSDIPLERLPSPPPMSRPPPPPPPPSLPQPPLPTSQQPLQGQSSSGTYDGTHASFSSTTHVESGPRLDPLLAALAHIGGGGGGQSEEPGAIESSGTQLDQTELKTRQQVAIESAIASEEATAADGFQRGSIAARRQGGEEEAATHHQTSLPGPPLPPTPTSTTAKTEANARDKAEWEDAAILLTLSQHPRSQSHSQSPVDQVVSPRPRHEAPPATSTATPVPAADPAADIIVDVDPVLEPVVAAKCARPDRELARFSPRLNQGPPPPPPGPRREVHHRPPGSSKRGSIFATNDQNSRSPQLLVPHEQSGAAGRTSVPPGARPSRPCVVKAVPASPVGSSETHHSGYFSQQQHQQGQPTSVQPAHGRPSHPETAPIPSRVPVRASKGELRQRR